MSTLGKLVLGAMGRLRPEPATGNSAPSIALPEPERHGGLPLMEALARRHSSRKFKPDPLPPLVLSALIVIVRHEEQRVGLVVDRVLGSHQTVIQSLGTFYRNIDMVSGATIMGDGRVALILNMAGLVNLASQRLRTEH